jgi:hypothetical protein
MTDTVFIVRTDDLEKQYLPALREFFWHELQDFRVIVECAVHNLLLNDIRLTPPLTKLILVSDPMNVLTLKRVLTNTVELVRYEIRYRCKGSGLIIQSLPSNLRYIPLARIVTWTGRHEVAIRVPSLIDLSLDPTDVKVNRALLLDYLVNPIRIPEEDRD